MSTSNHGNQWQRPEVEPVIRYDADQALAPSGENLLNWHANMASPPRPATTDFAPVVEADVNESQNDLLAHDDLRGQIPCVHDQKMLLDLLELLDAHGLSEDMKIGILIETDEEDNEETDEEDNEETDKEDNEETDEEDNEETDEFEASDETQITAMEYSIIGTLLSRASKAHDQFITWHLQQDLQYKHFQDPVTSVEDFQSLQQEIGQCFKSLLPLSETAATGSPQQVSLPGEPLNANHGYNENSGGKHAQFESTSPVDVKGNLDRAEARNKFFELMETLYKQYLCLVENELPSCEVSDAVIDLTNSYHGLRSKLNDLLKAVDWLDCVDKTIDQ